MEKWGENAKYNKVAHELLGGGKQETLAWFAKSKEEMEKKKDEALRILSEADGD